MKPSLLDRSDPTPLYHQLQESLESRIVSGEYVVGQMLPMSDELCREYQVSAITVRKALENLARQGVIERVRSVGSRVISLPDSKVKVHQIAKDDRPVFRMMLASPVLDYVRSDFFQSDLQQLQPEVQFETVTIDDLPGMLDCGIEVDLAMAVDYRFRELLQRGVLRKWNEAVAVGAHERIRDSWHSEIPRLFGEEMLEYFLPVVVSPLLLFYNATLLRACGVEDIPNDYHGFTEVCSRLRETFEKEGGKTRYPLLLELGNYRRWPLAFYAKGARIWSEDGMRCLLDSQEARQGGQIYHELVNELNVAVNVFEQKAALEQMAFTDGSVAMHFGSYPYLKRYEQQESFEVRAVMSPFDSQGTSLLMGGALCLPTTCRYPELAAKVVELLLSDKHQSRILANRIHMPVNNKVIQPWLEHSATASQKRLTRTFLEALRNTVPLEYPRGEKDVMFLHQQMNLAWLDMKNVGPRCKDVAAKVNAWLTNKEQYVGDVSGS